MYTLRHGSEEKTTKKIFQKSNGFTERADTESAKQKVTRINCNILLKNDPSCFKTWKAVSLRTDTSISREFGRGLNRQREMVF